MPTCEICGSGNRSYSHAKVSFHKKRLFKRMKEKKQLAIKTHGWFKY